MLNPVFRREIRTSLRSFRAYLLVMIYVLSLTAVVGISLYAMSNNSYYNAFNPRDTTYIYAILSGFQFGIIFVITPALTAGAISGEREKQTLNLMLITKMSTFAIAAGKLMSSLIIVLMMILASMPVYAIAFYFGGLSMFNLLGMVLYTMLSAGAVGSIAIFFSSVMKKTTGSTVMTYLSIIASVLGSIFTAFVVYLIVSGLTYSYYGELTPLGEAIVAIDAYLEPKQLSIQLILNTCMFVFNPAVGFMSIIDSQLGTRLSSEFVYGISNLYYSGGYRYLSFHIINGIIDIFVIVLMLYLTSRSLVPVKNSKRFK